MSSGERPIGAAKGKQLDTEALCQPPPWGGTPRGVVHPVFRGGCRWAGWHKWGAVWSSARGGGLAQGLGGWLC